MFSKKKSTKKVIEKKNIRRYACIKPTLGFCKNIISYTLKSSLIICYKYFLLVTMENLNK